MSISTEPKVACKQGGPSLDPGQENGHSSTCVWQNPHADCQGLLQGDVGNLADVSGACGAWLGRHRGRNAVGSHHALPEAGEGSTRDLGWNATQFLSNPRHGHIQRIVAGNAADQGRQRGLVCQVQLYFGGSWGKNEEEDFRGTREGCPRACRGARSLLRVEVHGGDWNFSVFKMLG